MSTYDMYTSPVATETWDVPATYDSCGIRAVEGTSARRARDLANVCSLGVGKGGGNGQRPSKRVWRRP